jgi:motility quorum-sensing regulator/GCU-specific mRNA interferase toxin
MRPVSEKLRPTYDLDAFKASFSTVSRLHLTGTALRSAIMLGFGRAEILATLQSMQRAHFHKSMTSHVDHRVWQDVYYVPSVIGLLYVKFTADTLTEFLLLSFKEKDHD